MVRHGGSSAGSHLADPTSPIRSHCASFVATSTLRVNKDWVYTQCDLFYDTYKQCNVMQQFYPELGKKEKTDKKDNKLRQ